MSLKQAIENWDMNLNPNIDSFLIAEGVECFYEAYDKGDNDCLYEFWIPRAKHELCYIDDDGEAFENIS